jgi:hypothetical protein
LSYRDPGDEDTNGFFMVLLLPCPTQQPKPCPKTLPVLDLSGSMDGENSSRLKKLYATS